MVRQHMTRPTGRILPMLNPFSSTAFLSVLLALALALSMAPGARAQDSCDAPTQPDMPDGSSASMEEMLAGQTAVKEFQAANMAYMQCLEAVFAAAEKTVKSTRDKAERAVAEATYEEAVEAYNAAVSKEQQVAGDFNVALREYRAAN